MDRVERRLDATTKLIQQGMKLLVQFQEENRYAIRSLIDAQQRAEARQDRAEARLQRTEELLNKLLAAWLKRSPNGR